MSREIDIKALVSHLVRGDGTDKCRICMGDTSEGQVYLGDTVMMDGDRPVTLAELLEVITGVEVTEARDLPSGLCSLCSSSAIDAANFSILCRKANHKWYTTVHLLENLPIKLEERSTALYALLQGDQMTITTDVKDEALEPTVVDQPPYRSTPSPPRDSLQVSGLKKVRKRYKILHCQCPSCGRMFKCAEHLSKHLKDSSDFNRACHVCACIMNRDDLIKHVKEEHGVKPFACKKCPALFFNGTKYSMHMSSEHARGACVCGDCGRSFQTEQAFRAHQSVHTLKSCPVCDKLFRNRACYVYHVRTCCDLDKNRQDMHKTKHKVTIEVKNKISKKKVKVGLRGSSQNECICDYCNKKFAGKKFVAAHIQIVHTKNTHTPCPYCGKFYAAAHMPTHIKTHEKVVPVFQCEHCNLVLKTKLGYIQHLRLHTGERPYECKHCGETFSASSRRSEHIRRMHSSETSLRHACKLCPARFALPFRLRKHMATVHSDEAENAVQFECPECHEKFSSCRGLIHHSRKHQKGIVRKPVKRIVVPVPIKVFSQADNDIDDIINTSSYS